MYKGIPFSPISTLTANISATDTIIPVSDVNAFPEAPSIAVIGPDIGPNETIIYAGKTTTALTGCTRGVESTASEWDIDEIIARNFTAKDHNDIIDNIKDLALNKLDATYKVDVVNDSTITAGGKALDARQNNPNVEGTLAKKIADNTNKINILNGKVNVNKIYTALTQINGSAHETTPMDVLFGWMENNSIAIFEISYMDNNVYPTGFGTCVIYKNRANKNGIEYIDTQTGERYVGSCHVNFASGFSGWRKLATSITSTLTLLNGWAVNSTDDDLIVSRSGDLVNIHGVIKKDSSITIGEDIAILPDIYIPTILRRSVVIDVNSNTVVGIDVNTDGSIKWYGGALDSISQIRIDITYTV